MKNTETELSTRYYVTEATIWLLGAVLVVSRFFGLSPDQEVPVLNITPAHGEHLPKIVATLLVAGMLYLMIEWKQSSRKVPETPGHSFRAIVTGFWAMASLWLAYPVIAKNTPFAGLSPAWYLGFAAIGFFVGAFVSVLASSALVIRTSHEAKKLRLPRIPSASLAQFIAWTPVVVLLIVAYYILLSIAPTPVYGIAGALTAIPFTLMVGEGLASFFFAHDENGERIPYARRVACLKEIHDSHDYAYILIDHGKNAVNTLKIPTSESPQAIQKAIRERFSAELSQAPLNFHVQQLEEMQLQFYPKDGDPANQDPQNSGVRVHKRQGKHESIRVLFIPNDSNHSKRELSISASSVEKYAEEYIQGHPDQQSINFPKVFSHAINKAVVESMVNDAGPLLHRLVQSGQEKHVAKLLEEKTDVNEKAEAGWTPLLYAAAQGYPRIARMLLDAGANPDIGNAHGITSLMYGARYGNKEVCQVLLEYEADINAQDIYGMTALIVASREGHLDIVELLLNASANPLIKTSEGKTALDFAYACGQGRIAKILKRANKALQRTS